MWSWYSSVGNSIVYWIHHFTHHTWSRDNSNCRQSVSSVIYWGIFRAAYSEDWHHIVIQPITAESVHYSPVISSHSNIHIISLVFSRKKGQQNRYNAIMSSCFERTSNYLHLFHLHLSIPVIWILTYTIYAITDIKIAWAAYGIEFILPTLRRFSTVTFPF